MIDHSLARFRREPQTVLCQMLEQLIMDIRRTLIHPDMPNAAKLAHIEALVNEQAPPPPPEMPVCAQTATYALGVNLAAAARQPAPSPGRTP